MSNKIYTPLGASNHTTEIRDPDDYYATDPSAFDILDANECFVQDIWEPACGGGHLSKRMESLGYTVKSTDLFDRGYGTPGIDFLECTESFQGNIITNPPYKYAEAFCRKAIQLADYKVAMFLRLQFLEGKARKKLFTEHPPAVVYVSSSRIQVAKNADFERMIAGGGSAVAYAWFVWYSDWHKETVIRWVN